MIFSISTLPFRMPTWHFPLHRERSSQKSGKQIWLVNFIANLHDPFPDALRCSINVWYRISVFRTRFALRGVIMMSRSRTSAFLVDIETRVSKYGLRWLCLALLACFPCSCHTLRWMACKFFRNVSFLPVIFATVLLTHFRVINRSPAASNRNFTFNPKSN